MAAQRPLPSPDLDVRHRRQRYFNTPAPWPTDRPGYLLHIVFAVGGCACLAGSTSVVEIGLAPLYVLTGIRLVRTWRTTLDMLIQPHILWFLAWGMYSVLSLAWSADPGNWMTDLNSLRWLALPIALWPIVHHRRVVLIAIAIGFGVMVCAQLAHLFEVRTGAHIFGFERAPGRISAWQDPVAGGSLLVAALGLCLPAMLSKRRALQVGGAVGSALMLVGIALTGTRGAWIAAVLLFGVTAVCCLFSAPVRSLLLRRLPIVVVAGVVLLAGVWVFAGAGLKDRIDRGIDEVSLAVERGEFTTDTGARIAMWQQAARGVAHSPAVGLGSGGYTEWARADADERELVTNIHAHAHGLVPHLLATHGLIGAVLFGGFVLSALRAAARYRTDPADLGPALALAGLLLAGLFDTVQVNMQTAALAGALIGLSPARAPSDTP